ncbi:MAG: sigma 54-interacting transcriptional regulator [Desulfobacterales bacterium]|nr:sigma 54-interacting transcriptional regulator [Desulfobacterales bacterium]
MIEHELDRYWKTVVNTLRDGLMIVDERGIIVSVNDALERITGYSRAELIGNDCSILNCDVCQNIRANGGGERCSLFAGQTVKGRQCVIVRKDGSIMHALKSACLLNDDQGDRIGAVDTITDITELIEKENQIAAYERQLRSDDGFCGLIGTSPPMRRVFDLIANAAQSDAPVIILGESGTGKELAAQAIHQIGARADKPFVKVNCASFTESLLESELFGHVRGAYTGAYRDRAGRFEAADGGDIFMDEIGDLPLATQIKLLRVLEEKIVERVGDATPVPVDVRIISASNRNLPDLIRRGQFREDLFFRINVIPILLPPLRERREDIPLLAESFFHNIGLKNRKSIQGIADHTMACLIGLKNRKSIQGIADDTMACLMAYAWPGNVRELKSAFEYAFVTCQESTIRPRHLPPNLQSSIAGVQPPTARSAFNRQEIQRMELIEALEATEGNQSRAAELLGVTRVTIWNRMRRFGVLYKKKMEMES